MHIASPDHHTTTTMFDCWYDLFMKCRDGFMRDVTGHTSSKKFNLCLISQQNICQKVLWTIKIFFWQMWDEPFCSFWSAVAFALELSHGCCFCPVIDLNWGKWGLQFFRCLGFFYDLLESSLRFWSNFGRPVTPGKVHHCYKFSRFVDNGSDHDSLESQSLRNGFITYNIIMTDTCQLFCFSSVLEFL